MSLVQSFINLIVPIIIIGLVVWVILMLPIVEPYKEIIKKVAIVLVVLYLLYALIGYAGAHV